MTYYRLNIIILLILTNVLLMSGEEMRILNVHPSPPPIKINGKSVKSGDTFVKGSSIEWGRRGQHITFQSIAGGQPHVRTSEQDLSKDKEGFLKTYLKVTSGSGRGTKLTFEKHKETLKDGDIVRTETIEKRIALVVGNSLYSNTSELTTPSIDAYGVKNKLLDLGFDVFMLNDATAKELENALTQFSAEAEKKKYDVALFYFAGHGCQIGEESYILPIDALVSSKEHAGGYDDGKGYWIGYWTSYSSIYKKLENSNCKTKLIFLDACRTRIGNLLEGEQSPSHSDVKGCYVVYSTTPDNEALDIADAEDFYSPFAKAFLDAISLPSDNLNTTIDRIDAAVSKKVNQHVYRIFDGKTPDFTFYNEVDVKKAAQAATQARDIYYSKGNPIDALELLYENMPHTQVDLNKPYSFEVENELRSILNDTISPHKILRGYDSTVKIAYFSEDNSKLLTVGSDSVLIIWDVETGQQLKKMNNVVLGCVASDLSAFAIEKNKTHFYIYETFSGRLISSIPCGEPAKFTEIGFTKDNKHVYTFNTETGLTIWDVYNAYPPAHIDKYFSTYWCDLSTNGELLAYTNLSKKNILELWNIANNKLLFSKTLDADKICGIKLINNDKYILTTDTDGNVIKWDINGNVISTLNVGISLDETIILDKNETNLIVHSEKSSSYILISLTNNSVIKILTGIYKPSLINEKVIVLNKNENELSNRKIKKTNKNAFTIDNNFAKHEKVLSLEVLDIHTGKPIGFYPLNIIHLIRVNYDKELALVALPNSKLLLLNLAKGDVMSELHQQYNSIEGMAAFNEVGGGFTFSRDGSYAATGTQQGDVIIWQINVIDNLDKKVHVPPLLSQNTEFFIDDDNIILNTDSTSINIVNINNNQSKRLDCSSRRFFVANNLIFIDQDEQIAIYDYKNQKYLKSLPISNGEYYTISNDKNHLALIKNNESLFVYNIKNRNLQELLIPIDFRSLYIQFLTTWLKNRIKNDSTSFLSLLQTNSISKINMLPSIMTSKSNFLAFSYDNSSIILCRPVVPTMKISSRQSYSEFFVWNTHDKSSCRRFSMQGEILSFNVSPVKNTLIARTPNKCYLVNYESGEILKTFDMGKDYLISAFYHPFNDMLVTISDKSFDNVQIFDQSSGSILKTLSGGQYALNNGMFSQDGKIFYAIGTKGIDCVLKAWSVTDWRPLFTQPIDKDKPFVGEYNGYLVYYNQDADRGDTFTKVSQVMVLLHF